MCNLPIGCNSKYDVTLDAVSRYGQQSMMIITLSAKDRLPVDSLDKYEKMMYC